MEKLNKRISSKDVAKVAGVSQSTVSRVFSDKAELISEKTRLKVKQVAEDLGYRPSSIASSLSKKRTNIIGIEINDFNNAYYMQALGYFSRAFEIHGYQLMIIPGNKASGLEAENMENRLKAALDYHVAGLILTNVILDDEYMNWCNKYNTPIFMFNRISGDNNKFNYVIGDNYQGAYEIGKLMCNKGLKNVAYIAGDKNSYTNLKREEGFYDSLKDSGVNARTIEGSFTYEDGYKAAKKILKMNTKIEAVFCASDSIALGFIDGIKHDSDLSIPKDIKVAGFDGIKDGENINYQLTSYIQPLEKIVNETVSAMVDMIESQTIKDIQLVIPGHLKIRESMK